MNKRDTEYFNLLSIDRAESAVTLEKPSMSGVKNSVVEKYSDQAHFIYELLQNADDAQATSVHFKLQKRRLIFSHNGKRHFSISNPRKEDKDRANGSLGDINAITAIGSSTKDKESTIGKFGVGFKAVFQYTTTPVIYDKNIHFRIERFIVPELVEEDFPGRNPEDTLFVFPFDHPARTKEEAVEKISNKLDSLVFPVLFLNHLTEITYECPNHTGKYMKEVAASYDMNNVHVEKLTLTQINSRKIIRHFLWKFTKTDSLCGEYSICIFEDENGKLISEDYPAFCFFPTKETTNLDFIIHAPFLLTDSREGIKEGVDHNENLISLLAKLFGTALLCFRDIGIQTGKQYIDENIFTILPYDKSKFATRFKRQLPWVEFYQEALRVFQNEKICPYENEYRSSTFSYWIGLPSLTKIISNQQLSMLAGKHSEYCYWLFPKLGRQDRARADFIGKIAYMNITEDILFRQIGDSFIERQSIEWLDTLYLYIAESKNRLERIKTLPIFLDSHRNASAAYNSLGHAILFLPNDDVSGYKVIHPSLMNLASAKHLIHQLGLRKPTLKDEIYNLILPQYNTGDISDPQLNILKMYKYYQNCSQSELQNYVRDLKKYNIVSYYTKSGASGYTRGIYAYFYSDDLHTYLNREDTKYIAIDEYKMLPGSLKNITAFFEALGVRSYPRIQKILPTPQDIAALNMNVSPDARILPESTIGSIDGCEDAIQRIVETSDSYLSVILWKYLLKLIDKAGSAETLIDELSCNCRYKLKYNYSEKIEKADGLSLAALRTQPWIILNTRTMESPERLHRDQLPRRYTQKDKNIDQLMLLLNITDDSTLEGQMTSEQRKWMSIGKLLSETGASETEIEKLIKKLEKKAKKPNSKSVKEEKRQKLAEEIIDRATKKPVKDRNAEITEPEADEDEYTSTLVDYTKKIEAAKKKSAEEIERILLYEELQEKAVNSNKYTYAWFRALLDLELFDYTEKTSQGKEISIVFSKVEREKGTEKTLVLSRPSGYIPHIIEDHSDIPLELQLMDKTVKAIIDVANIKSYTLRVKLKSAETLEGIDLSLIKEASISIKDPLFLQEKLRDAFGKLQLPDDFDMKANLSENLEFIFGPPGTGKTTYLAEKVLTPLMKKKDNTKVLVLTPTNKAADVLTRKIMDFNDRNHLSNEWLIRFGSTGDPTIEAEGIFKEKTFDITSMEKCILITTVARFPYDFFTGNDKRILLRNMKWDYIVFDEASMIPLANIVYPLYKRKTKKFIIAGDPFQIEPIASVDLLKNETIYTMINLDSFSEIKTEPHNYPVKLLTTQYRSLPEIGELYSRFAYDGKIKHFRKKNSRKKLKIKGIPKLKSLNVFKFPVSKYESIYRAKRLQGKSNYQIYSALFAYEFVKYLAANYVIEDGEQKLSVGIIAPYKAQADLIDKLLANTRFSADFHLTIGTIHSFQGDECDVILAVFNSPAYISRSAEMFLNKRNIINVAISRARDYLIILMPDDNTENVDNLTLVKRVENLCKESNAYYEAETSELEKKILGKSTYLEDNTFSTSHQNVNVYLLPEMKYEVRSEDTAVDIQIHE